MKANKTLYATVMAMLLIQGCTGRPPVSDETQDVTERIEELRSEPPAPRLERVLISRSEQALKKRIVAKYTNIEAGAALEAVTPNWRIRYNLAPYAPLALASAPPGATTVGDHIESIMAQADWAYRIADGVLQVYDIETRYFSLAVQPGATQADMKMRNLSTSDSGGSDNTVSVVLDPYTTELIELVETVLGLEAESTEPGQTDPRTAVAILPTANQLVVTARPSAMRRV